MKKITITWNIEDVKEIRKDLTNKQCSEVLELALRRHDAEIGINWEVLKIHAEYLYPER